jgi:hypothetical protein
MKGRLRGYPREGGQRAAAGLHQDLLCCSSSVLLLSLAMYSEPIQASPLLSS